MFGLDWGIAGSAWGTVIAQVLSAGVFLAIVVPSLRADGLHRLRRGAVGDVGGHQGRRPPRAADGVPAGCPRGGHRRREPRRHQPSWPAHQIAAQLFLFLAIGVDMFKVVGPVARGPRARRGSARRGSRRGRAPLRLGVAGRRAARRRHPGALARAPAPLHRATPRWCGPRPIALVVLAVMQLPAALTFVLDGVLMGANDFRDLRWQTTLAFAAALPVFVGRLRAAVARDRHRVAGPAAVDLGAGAEEPRPRAGRPLDGQRGDAVARRCWAPLSGRLGFAHPGVAERAAPPGGCAALRWRPSSGRLGVAHPVCRRRPRRRRRAASMAPLCGAPGLRPSGCHRACCCAWRLRSVAGRPCAADAWARSSGVSRACCCAWSAAQRCWAPLGAPGLRPSGSSSDGAAPGGCAALLGAPVRGAWASPIRVSAEWLLRLAAAQCSCSGTGRAHRQHALRARSGSRGLRSIVAMASFGARVHRRMRGQRGVRGTPVLSAGDCQ